MRQSVWTQENLVSTTPYCSYSRAISRRRWSSAEGFDSGEGVIGSGRVGGGLAQERIERATRATANRGIFIRRSYLTERLSDRPELRFDSSLRSSLTVLRLRRSTPGPVRTASLRFRKPPLYPIELRGPVKSGAALYRAARFRRIPRARPLLELLRVLVVQDDDRLGARRRGRL